jgi:putative ABC transport system ATP-binding protein
MSAAPALELDGVAKCFRGPDGERHEVLEIERLALTAGEQLALHGASGSGKTTLLHLIAGLLEPDRGRVSIAGEPMSGRPEPERDRLRGRAIGYVFQSFHLLPGHSALENVLLAMALGGNVDPARARALLERVGLGERVGHRPAELSLGQQQRVALARALANRPRLVLADEPTGSLDPCNAKLALELLREACAEWGAALLFVTHDRQILRRFERTLDLAALNRAGAGSRS